MQPRALVGRALLACALFATTACRSVLDIDEPLAPCFHDGFDDGDIDLTRWAPMDTTSPAILAVESGHLVIAPPPDVAAENGLATIDPLDFTDGTLEARVYTQTAPDQLETFFLVLTGDSTGFGFITSGGSLVAREFTAGVSSTDIFVPYDPTWTHWRIQHHADASAITFAVSADGHTYDTIRTLTDRPAPQIGIARLQAGIYSANPDPGQALFDAIDAVGPSCPSR